MARVALLSHVKESTIAQASNVPRMGPRMAWGGGKIVSNKDEALRKFYERKIQSGATLPPDQQRALEALMANVSKTTTTSSGASTNKKKNHHHPSKHDVIHKTNATTKRMAHRAHVKVQSKDHNNKTTKKNVLIVNGRVVGPRVQQQQQQQQSKKANASRSAVKITKAAVVVNKTKKQSSTTTSTTGAGLALQDKLGMSLDALVKRGGGNK